MRTDAWIGYEPLAEQGYDHEAVAVCGDHAKTDKHLPGIHIAFGNLAIPWFLGTAIVCRRSICRHTSTNTYCGSTVGSGLWSHLIASWGLPYEHQRPLQGCIKGSGNILEFRS